MRSKQRFSPVLRNLGNQHQRKSRRADPLWRLVSNRLDSFHHQRTPVKPGDDPRTIKPSRLTVRVEEAGDNAALRQLSPPPD